MHPITIRYSFRPVRRSLATNRVADLFGLPDREPPHTVADGVSLGVRPGDLVLFTGPSGSGKSSLLREAGRQLAALDAAALPLPDCPLVDALSGTVEQRLEWLAACGLSEARLVLRTPAELSDGQRYRFRLALAFDRVTGCGPGVRFLMADEFAALLDRTLARVLAFNVRKLVSRTGVGVLLATTHDDVADDLNPDVWVRCGGDGEVVVERRANEKKAPRSRVSYGCRRAPSPTGRTSLGGITAATTSPSSAGSCCCGTARPRSACASSRRRPPACGSGRGSSACADRGPDTTSRP